MTQSLNSSTNSSESRLFPYGSVVYGTNGPESDEDFIVVADNPEIAQMFADVLTKGGRKVDVNTYTHQEFNELLAKCDIVALECVYQDLPGNEALRPVIDPWKLRQSCSAIASNAWVKGKKKFQIGEDRIAKKSMWHSLRILNFGCQILTHGKIIDYGAVNFMYNDIMKMNSWEEIDAKYRSISRQMQTDFRAMAPKPGE